MTFQEEIDALRAMINGAQHKVISLRDTNYVAPEFISKAIDEYEKLPVRCMATGEKITALETIGVWALRNYGGFK